MGLTGIMPQPRKMEASDPMIPIPVRVARCGNRKERRA